VSGHLTGVEWQFKYSYLFQIEQFQSRELTEEERTVMEWMKKQVELLREKENQ